MPKEIPTKLEPPTTGKLQATPGLTKRSVPLSGDEAAAYQRNLQRYVTQYEPATPRETELTQSLADTQWRLLRIPALEMGIYALGRLENAGKFQNEDPAVQKALLDAHVFLTYQRQLNNLSVQETRLRGQYEKGVAELVKLQTERKEAAKRLLDKAAKLYEDAAAEQMPFDPAEFGFEFSIDQIRHHAEAYTKQVRIVNRAYYRFKKLQEAA
jgi:hypothetical protein